MIQRITEKVRSKTHRKALSVELSAALFHVDGELRAPNEMALRLQHAVDKISISSLKCAESEWLGCIANNVMQIRRGDLHVEHNTYVEAGVKVKVVSTSQLESFHSQLKRLLRRNVSIEVALRILDIFILQVCMHKDVSGQ